MALAPLWSRPVDGTLTAPPAFTGRRAYLPIDGERLDAWDLTQAARLWSVDVPVLTEPAIGGGLIYLDTGTTIVALDTTDGRPAWQLPLSAALGAPLVWDNEWLIALTTTGTVSAYRALDGYLVWRYESGSAPSAAAALAADRVYVSLSDSRILALQIENGALLWARSLGGVPGRMLALQDRLYVGVADGYFYALDPRSGSTEWRWRTGNTVAGPPVVDDRHVYFAALDNVLRALDRHHGALRWYAALPLRPTSAPVAVGPALLVSGLGPTLAAFARDDGARVATAKLPGDLAAAPFVVETPWAPLVVVVTRDVAQGDQLQALGRRVEPEAKPIAPLPRVIRMAPKDGPPRATPAQPSRGRSRKKASPATGP